MRTRIAICLGAVLGSLLLAPALAATPHPAFKVEVSGQGPAMILIPGLASSGEVWDGTVQHFCGAGKRQCHVLTLAGFAGQPALDGPLLAAAEQQLSQYITEQKLATPVLVGHSLGGFLALKLASDQPAQVGRLVIVDALPAMGAIQLPSITGAQLKQMGDGMRAQMLNQSADDFRKNARASVATMASTPADVERIAGWGQRSDQVAVANAMADMMSEDLRPQLASIKAPTLVLGAWIAYKQYASRAAIENTYQSQYAQLQGVKVELSDSARHFIMVDDPAWMYARMDQFLN